MMENFKEFPHRRYNPLLDEYVLVSPHRTQRPWQGRTEAVPQAQRPRYDPTCYLCPGNTRNSGEVNPQYESTFVFTNDYSALLPDAPSTIESPQNLLHVEGVQGTGRVICFSPRHDLTLAEMSPAEIRTVIDLWADQTTELGQRYTWVQVFENRGEMMGSSNPHPHGQIWAENIIPNLPLSEDIHQKQYYETHGRPLLLDYALLELEQGERVIVQNETWLVVVPFWAVWPFETLVLPKFAVQTIPDLTSNQRDGLADILKQLLVKYDNLFEISFPYSMGWHGAPFNGQLNDHWQLHAHFYPPLLRSATVRKFMVGYEMLGEAQRDITPEQAAARLQELSELHYKDRS
jgi:UDPglucose--hexose-1-phosphate uridylyltransferase